MDPKKMTRSKAEKLVAATSDVEALQRFAAEHGNKHVRAKAAYKAAKLAEAEVSS